MCSFEPHKHKTKRKAICSKLLACIEAEGEACLTRVITADESWVHNSGNKEEIHATAPSSIYLAEKIQKIPPSADKAMITVIWDCKGVIIVDINAARGDNSNAHIRMLKELGKHFKTV
jgi:hypothetical protein